MFNSYSVRPVGSKRFEEHIQDIMVSRYYERGEENETDLCIDHAEAPWGSSRTVMDDGWDRLTAAVISLAILDYTDAYMHKVHCQQTGDDAHYWVWESRCIELENFFFKENELDYIFEGVLEKCQEGGKELRNMEKRICETIFWSHNTQEGRKRKCRA